MTQKLCTTKGTVVAATCWFTAIVNAVFNAGAQDSAAFRPSPVEGEPEIHVLQYGIFDVRPTLFGTIAYDDNILTRDINKRSDVVFTFSPSVLLGAGDYRQREAAMLTFSYTPSFIFYADNTRFNRNNHELEAEAMARPGKWTLGLKQDVRILTGTDSDVGTLVDRNIYTTHARVAYEISPKTSAELGAALSVNDYDLAKTVNNYKEWSVSGFVDYALTPKVKVGGGVTAGWVNNEGANIDQSYQQFLVRSLYSWSEKLDFTGKFGLEVREFGESGSNQSVGNEVNPVLSLGATYRPDEKFSLSAEAHRRVESSVVLANQNYTTTGFSLTARYLLNDRWAFNFGGAYDRNEYHATAPNVPAQRRDNIFSARVGADWRITERFVAGLFYQYRINDSTGGGPQFKYSNNQVGLSLAYRF